MVPGTSMPYVCSPAPAGWSCVKAIASCSTCAHVVGTGRFSFLSQSLRTSSTFAWALNGTAYVAPCRSVTDAQACGVSCAASAMSVLLICWRMPWFS